MEPDEELVRRARSGDSAAFGLLIERHQKSVAGFILAMVHDIDMAEEAAQLAFVKAYKSLGGFQGRSSFKTWVSQIAVNVARSQLRWLKVRSWLPLDAPRGEERQNWEETLRGAVGTGDEREKLEKRLELERAMEGLAAREREITALRLEGYSLGEIGQILEISEGTVKSTLFTATKKMRERLS